MKSVCASFEHALLTAEPDELRGEGETLVAVHVRGCPSCARRAHRILAATAELDAALNTVASVRGPAPRRRPRAWAGAAALAAAAALGALMLGRPQPTPGGRPGVGQALEMAARAPVGVRPPPDRRVMVMQADDNVTVVWLF